MAKTLAQMTPEEIWAAGVLSAFGSLVYLEFKNSNPDTIRLIVRSTRFPKLIQRFADAAGSPMTAVNIKGKYEGRAYQVNLSGKPLHNFMTALWPALGSERKAEYAALRKRLKLSESVD